MSTIGSGSLLPVQYQVDQYKNRLEQVENGLKKENTKNQALYQACQDFEAVFFQLMLKEMRKTVHKTGISNGGFGEEVFQSMLDDETAKSAAKQGGSIADLLYKQLRIQLDGES